MIKKCSQCKEDFETESEYQSICSEECKQKALEKLDRDSNECLSCQ